MYIHINIYIDVHTSNNSNTHRNDLKVFVPTYTSKYLKYVLCTYVPCMFHKSVRNYTMYHPALKALIISNEPDLKAWSSEIRHLDISNSVWKKHNATRCNKRYNVDSLTATHFPKDFQSFAHLFEQLHSWSQGPSTTSDSRSQEGARSLWAVEGALMRLDAPCFSAQHLCLSLASHWGVPCDDY